MVLKCRNKLPAPRLSDSKSETSIREPPCAGKSKAVVAMTRVCANFAPKEMYLIFMVFFSKKQRRGRKQQNQCISPSGKSKKAHKSKLSEHQNFEQKKGGSRRCGLLVLFCFRGRQTRRGVQVQARSFAQRTTRSGSNSHQ